MAWSVLLIPMAPFEFELLVKLLVPPMPRQPCMLRARLVSNKSVYQYLYLFMALFHLYHEHRAVLLNHPDQPCIYSIIQEWDRLCYTRAPSNDSNTIMNIRSSTLWMPKISPLPLLRINVL